MGGGAGRLIAFNALVSYARSLAALGLGLFASRWTLQALGASDFGIYVAVGALIAFGTFFGNILGLSVSRHLAFAVGRGDPDDVAAWMRASCAAHLALACVASAVLWPIGEWAVRSVVCIPQDRLDASLAVYRCSLAMFFVTTATVPFGAAFTANQRFAVPSVVETLRSVWQFGWAFWLVSAPGDRLVRFAVYSLAGLVAARAVFAICAVAMFGPVKWTCGVDMRRLRKVVSIAGWNACGGGGYLVAVHGSAFVTNRFFGTVGNAAYGIAQQVQFHAEALANALIEAFSPAVTARSGAGDAEGTRCLAGRAGLLSPLLLALIAVPLVVEMPTVLSLWLDVPPAHSAVICSVFLSVSVVNKLTIGQQLALSADGRIAGWQLVSGVAQAIALPLAAVYAALGGGVVSAAAAYATVFSGCIASNLFFGQKIAGMSILTWAARVAAPFFAVVSCATAAAILPRLWMSAGILRTITSSVASSAVFALCFVALAVKWKRST